MRSPSPKSGGHRSPSETMTGSSTYSRILRNRPRPSDERSPSTASTADKWWEENLIMSRNRLAMGAMATILVVVEGTTMAQDRDLRLFADGIRKVFIQGTASIAMIPDVAQVQVGAETRAATAREALAANNQAMGAMMDALKQQGIGPRDVRTVSLTLNPLYDRPVNQQSGGKLDGPPPKIVGYQINNKVGITARDITKVGDLLDAVVKTGVNEIEHLSFQVGDPQAALRDLRKQALADARAKAEELAKEAAMTLGPPLSIEVDDSPSYGGGRFNALPPPRYERTVPIAAGVEQFRVAVGVVYELKPPK